MIPGGYFLDPGKGVSLGGGPNKSPIRDAGGGSDLGGGPNKSPIRDARQKAQGYPLGYAHLPDPSRQSARAARARPTRHAARDKPRPFTPSPEFLHNGPPALAAQYKDARRFPRRAITFFYLTGFPVIGRVFVNMTELC